MKRRLKIGLLICSAAAVLSPCVSAVEPENYIGFYSDMSRSLIDWHVYTPYSITEIYTWIYTEPGGIIGAVYKADSSSYCIPVHDEYNPDIISYEGSPYGAPGMDITFSSCQEGWIFINKVTLLSLNSEIPQCEILVTASAHSGTGELEVTRCADPEETKDLGLLNFGYFNCDPMWVREFPEIIDVQVAGPATLDINYMYLEYPTYPVHFTLYNESDRMDSIVVAGFTPPVYPSLYSRLELGSPMESGTTYILAGRGSSLNGRTMVSWERFTYEAPIGTFVSFFDAVYRENAIRVSWRLSEIDDDARFIVMRSEMGGDYVRLTRGSVESSGLSCIFADETVSQNSSYVYRVDYMSRGSIRNLFVTDPVVTPAMPLSLDNYPNPFNPATTIRYNLTRQSQVLLEIFDISGKRIAGLVDEYQDEGPHSIEWQGLDSECHPVSSGIYIYRLKAGKETISKKMVLLR